VESKRYEKQRRFEVIFNLTPEEKLKLNSLNKGDEKNDYLKMLMDLENTPEVIKKPEKEINEHDMFY